MDTILVDDPDCLHIATAINHEQILPIDARGGRLFQPDYKFGKQVTDGIQDIVKIIQDWPIDGFTNIPQGYTYLGQFLAHELANRGDSKQRTGRLDLDSLYGKDAVIDQFGYFSYTQARGPWSRDLLRGIEDKHAHIPEARNDEHLIISQLHLLFQLFHNRVLKQIESSNKGSTMTARQRYNRARGFVIASVQRVYAEDYLKILTDPKIFERPDILEIFTSGQDLPIEVTHATLRFGHSLVRENYRLNIDPTERALSKLFSFGGANGGPDFEGIPKSHEIDWRIFFDWLGHDQGLAPEHTMRINPAIATPMKALPEGHPNIVERNIEAGAKAALPSGQAIACCLLKMEPKLLDCGVHPHLRVREHRLRQQEKLEKVEFWEQTPLWLFILMEADYLSAGNHLGPLGSLFLCETIRNSISGAGMLFYKDVQKLAIEDFNLTEIGTMVELVTFTEPRRYRSPIYKTMFYRLVRIFKPRKTNGGRNDVNNTQA